MDGCLYNAAWRGNDVHMLPISLVTRTNAMHPDVNREPLSSQHTHPHIHSLVRFLFFGRSVHLLHNSAVLSC